MTLRRWYGRPGPDHRPRDSAGMKKGRPIGRPSLFLLELLLGLRRRLALALALRLLRVEPRTARALGRDRLGAGLRHIRLGFGRVLRRALAETGAIVVAAHRAEVTDWRPVFGWRRRAIHHIAHGP